MTEPTTIVIVHGDGGGRVMRSAATHRSTTVRSRQVAEVSVSEATRGGTTMERPQRGNRIRQIAVALACAAGLVAGGLTATPAFATVTWPGVLAWGATNGGGLDIPDSVQTGVTELVAGDASNFALKGGAVIAWGYNGSGQTTVPVDAQSGVTHVAAGYYHALALKAGGVIAWGDDSGGQITVPPAALSGVTAVAAGVAHSVALSGGQVIVWGSNSSGQADVPVAAQSGVTAIAAGAAHTVALKDGAVIAWGANTHGESTVPAAATSGVSAIAAGDGFTLALKDGQVLAWGDPTYGATAVPTDASSGVTAISAKYRHVVALKQGGVLAWGSNLHGQTTVPPEATSGVSLVAAGATHTAVVTVLAAPAQVTSPSATVGDGEVTLGWTAPDPTLGRVAGYRIDQKTGGGPWTTRPEDPLDTSTSRVFSGLANGTTYSFRITAWNPLGEGAASDIATAVPGRTPSQPTIATITSTPSGLELSWAAPPDGGHPISGYTIGHRPMGAGLWTEQQEGPATTTATIGSLTLGSTYQVRLSAHNDLGESAASATSTVPFMLPAGAPTDVVATGVNHAIHVSWVAPVDTGGPPISGYIVRVRDVEPVEGSWSSTPASAAATEATVSGLPNGRTYEVRVAATTPAGTGAESPGTFVAVSGSPELPITEGAVADAESVLLTWRSGGDGGSPLQHYIVEWRTAGSAAWNEITVPPASTALRVGTPADVDIESRVTAVNAFGSSDPADFPVAVPFALVRSATVSATVIRPFRDGYQDSTTVRVAVSVRATATFTVLNSRGRAVGSWALPAATGWTRTWAATTPAGARVANGTYRLQIRVTWPGGSRIVLNRTVSVLSSQVGSPSLSLSQRTVYPVKDGFRDSVTVTASSTIPAGGTITIKSGSQVALKRTLRRASHWSLTWNGRSDGQIRTGKYTVTVTIRGGEGAPRSRASTVIISSKRLVKHTATSTATYTARYARDDCWTSNFSLCEDGYAWSIGGSTYSGVTRYYNGTASTLWSAHSLPLPAGTYAYRIRVVAATYDASFVLGHCYRDAAEPDDCPAGDGVRFPYADYGGGTYNTGWSRTGASDRRADFFIGTNDWGSLYVARYILDVKRTYSRLE